MCRGTSHSSDNSNDHKCELKKTSNIKMNRKKYIINEKSFKGYIGMLCLDVSSVLCATIRPPLILL